MEPSVTDIFDVANMAPHSTDSVVILFFVLLPLLSYRMYIEPPRP